MTPADQLAALFSPAVLAALEEYVAERVAAELDGASGESGSPWLTVQEAAQRARVSTRTITRAIGRDRLRSHPVGSRRLIHRDDLDAWIERAAGEE